MVAVDSLDAFASALFRSTGMDEDKADTVGRMLVLTDMMGRRTHGLAMVPLYLAEIRSGRMSITGRRRGRERHRRHRRFGTARICRDNGS